MTRAEAVHKYFNDFMPSYRDTNVPDDATFPRLIYTSVDGGIAFEQGAVTVNIWHKTESESIPDNKATEFKKYIRDNDTIVYDEGAILVTIGTPFCQAMTDPTDDTLKRRYINITFENLSF